MPAKVLKDWISCRAVARELEVNPKSVDAIVLAAGIRVKRLPGLDPRYSLTDVLRIKTEAVASQPNQGAA